jgi:hypothetical protein
MADVESNRRAVTQVVETYLRCVVSGNFSELPITEDYGSESPRSGLLRGRAAVDYLRTIGPEMADIRIVQHVVEGDYVVTHFEEVTAEGTLPIVGIFEVRDGRVRFVRVFFDTAAPGA